MSKPLTGQYGMGFTMATLMRDLGARGLYASAVPRGTLIHIHTRDEQTITMEMYDPLLGSALISAGGPWNISMHLSEAWGCTLFPHGLPFRLHWLMVGERFVLGPLMTPPITKIDIQLPADKEMP